MFCNAFIGGYIIYFWGRSYPGEGYRPLSPPTQELNLNYLTLTVFRHTPHMHTTHTHTFLFSPTVFLQLNSPRPTSTVPFLSDFEKLPHYFLKAHLQQFALARAGFEPGPLGTVVRSHNRKAIEDPQLVHLDGARMI